MLNLSHVFFKMDLFYNTYDSVYLQSIYYIFVYTIQTYSIKMLLVKVWAISKLLMIIKINSTPYQNPSTISRWVLTLCIKSSRFSHGQ